MSKKKSAAQAAKVIEKQARSNKSARKGRLGELDTRESKSKDAAKFVV